MDAGSTVNPVNPADSCSTSCGSGCCCGNVRHAITVLAVSSGALWHACNLPIPTLVNPMSVLGLILPDVKKL
jgi:hypothetical protein